jgi:hypothetical protein
MRVKNFRKLLLDWKRGIEEAERQEAIISFKEVDRLFKVFHLSVKMLDSEKFEFTPRVPAAPYDDESGNVIEDDFTKRISLGPTIEKCQEALGPGRVRARFVYAADVRDYSKDDIDVVPLKVFFKGCDTQLSSPDNEYGPDFNFDDWSDDYVTRYHDELTRDDADRIASADKPSKLPPEERHMFYACVPDAQATEEVWSKEPVNLYFIGEIEQKKIRLSKSGIKVISMARELTDKK